MLKGRRAGVEVKERGKERIRDVEKRRGNGRVYEVGKTYRTR